jgi:uncharacterized protein YoxC
VTIDTPGGYEDVVIRGLTWPKLLAIVGAILASVGIVIYVLIGVVYGGLQGRLDSLEKRVQGLDDNVRRAAADTSVKELVDKVPKVERTITYTHASVATIKIQLQALQNDIVGIKQQQQAMEQSLNQVGFAHPATPATVTPRPTPHPTKLPRRR